MFFFFLGGVSASLWSLWLLVYIGLGAWVSFPTIYIYIYDSWKFCVCFYRHIGMFFFCLCVSVVSVATSL